LRRFKLNENQQALVRQMVEAAKASHAAAYEIPRTSARDVDKFMDAHERNLALVNGTYWDKVAVDEPVMQINHITPCLTAKHAIVTGGETVFVVHGMADRYEAVRGMVKGLINHAWTSLKFDAPINRAEWDRYAHRFGVVEVGWRFETPKGATEGQKPDYAAPDEDITDFAQDNIPDDALPTIPGMEQSFTPQQDYSGGAYPGSLDAEGGASPLAGIQGGGVTPLVSQEEAPPYASEYVIYDDPFVERFSPRDFFVDPACTMYTLEDARYVWRRKAETVAQVKRNKLYRNTKGLGGTLRSTYESTRISDDGGSWSYVGNKNISDDVKVVELWDGYLYMDRNHDGVEELLHVVFAPEIQKEILVEETPYQYLVQTGNPFPFRVIPGRLVDNDSFYQTCDVEGVADIQRAHDMAYTLTEYQRSHSPNILQLPIELDGTDAGEDLKHVIESGVENAIAWLPNSLIGRCAWLSPPPAHQDSYAAMASARTQILENIGVSEYQTATVPDGPRRTATEASQIASQGSTRQDSEVALFHDFIQDIAFCVLILFQQFIDSDRDYVSSDNRGHQTFGKVSVETLRNGKTDGPGDIENLLPPGIQFVVSVDPSKKQSPNPMQDRQDATQLLQIMSPFCDLPDPLRPEDPTARLVSRRQLLESVLGTFDLPNQDEIIAPVPTPGEQQNTMGELMGLIQKQAQQIQQLQGPAQNPQGQGKMPQQPLQPQQTGQPDMQPS
jgi:hypothetical protein